MMLMTSTGAGPFVDTTAELIGTRQKNNKRKDIEHMEEHPLEAMLPGMSKFRLGSKSRYVEKLLSPVDKNVSTHHALSVITTELIPALIGASIMARSAAKTPAAKALRKESIIKWLNHLKQPALKGGAIGYMPGVIGNAIGGLVGMLGHPSPEKLINYYKNPDLAKAYLLPGFANYMQGRAAILADDMLKA